LHPERTLIGIAGLAIATAMGVAWVAFPSHHAVGVPLDKFSAERSKTLREMWVSAACEENPREINCNANAVPPRPFCVPLSLQEASVPALTVPCATATPCTSTGSPIRATR
jgi:hypothetical protein